MKVTYIYLNEYFNGSLYVGSHTWDGPEGVLDPNYHGSSHVAKLYNWVPIKETILEVVSKERKVIAERYWILKYCELYGIHPSAVACDKGKNSGFTNRFKVGLMLNCHSNSAEQLGHSREVWLKSHETRLKNGAFQRFQDATNKVRSDKIRALKSRDSHNYSEVAKKLSKTINENGVKRDYYNVLVKINGKETLYKSVTSATKLLGLYSWQRCVCRHLKVSDSYERDGIIFIKVKRI